MIINENEWIRIAERDHLYMYVSIVNNLPENAFQLQETYVKKWKNIFETYNVKMCYVKLSS